MTALRSWATPSRSGSARAAPRRPPRRATRASSSSTSGRAWPSGGAAPRRAARAAAARRRPGSPRPTAAMRRISSTSRGMRSPGATSFMRSQRVEVLVVDHRVEHGGDEAGLVVEVVGDHRLVLAGALAHGLERERLEALLGDDLLGGDEQVPRRLRQRRERVLEGEVQMVGQPARVRPRRCSTLQVPSRRSPPLRSPRREPA